MYAEIDRQVAQRLACDAQPRERSSQSVLHQRPSQSRAAPTEIEMEDVSEPFDINRIRETLSQAPHLNRSLLGDAGQTNVIGNSSDME